MSAPREKTRYPGVFKRGGRYQYTFRDPRGATRWASAATLAEARAAKSAAQADVARGEFRALSRVTFEEYARRWIVEYQGRTARGIGPETRSDYRRILGLDEEGLPTGFGAVAYFRNRRLVEIEPRDIKAYASHVTSRPRRRGSGPLSPGTVKLELAPVKALLATAVEDGLIRFNPSAGLRNLVPRRIESVEEDDDDSGKIKALRHHELEALLDSLPEYWRLFFEFLVYTGLRIGEAIEVRYRDLDLGTRTLEVRRCYYRGRVDRPKSGKTRRIRLTEDTARALWALRKDTRAGDDDLVFTAERGGRIEQSNLMARVLKPAGRASGVGEWIGFHTFRHTCATLLFLSGWNAVQVQTFLGHSDPGFTLRRYVHVLPDDLPEPQFGLTALGITEKHPVERDARDTPDANGTTAARRESG